MKINKILILLVTAAFFMVSCEKDQKPNVNSSFFLKKTVVGFYHEAKAIYTVNKNTDQLYYNKANNTFRILSDDGAKYLEVVFNSPIPGIGHKVTASVKNAGLGSVKNYSSIEFEVLNTEDGACWLWNQDEGLGVIAFFMK